MTPPAPCSYAVRTDAEGSACWEVCAGGVCVRDRSRKTAERLVRLTLALLARQSNSQHQPWPGPSGDHRRAQLPQE